MKQQLNKKRLTIFLVGLFFCLTLLAVLPQVSATLTSTDGDGWADVDMAWFAKTRHGGAGGFRASVGVDPTTPSGQDGYFTGGWKWVSGTTYHFELVYTSSTELAELYVTGQNGGAPICQYTVGLSSGKIGINARTAPETGMTTIIENIKFNDVSVTPDDSVTATSTAGESAVRHLLIKGADMSSDFSIKGDFTFTYGSSTHDECPSMVIDFENLYDRMCTIHFVTPFRGVDGDLSGWSTVDNMVNLSTDEWSLLDGNATVKGYTRQKNDHYLTQRGTRGLGLNGHEDDEIDSYDRPEVIEILFDLPYFVDYIEVRSLFDESWGIEEGEIELWLDDDLLDTIHLVGIEPKDGTNKGLVGTDINPPVIVDKIIFWVPPNEPYTSGSEFAVAKVNVTAFSCTPICRNVEDDIEYCTIQDAIDAATTDDGETIEVYSGTFQEDAASYCDINLYKDVSLIGQGSGNTIIELTEGKSEGLQIVGSRPTDISIEGMTLTYQSGSTNAAKRALRIFSDLNSFNLNDLVVKYAEVNNVEINGDITTLTIDNCNFHHAGSNGLICPADIGSGSITNSNFDYNGRLDVWASGMHLFGEISNIDIIGCSMSYNTDSGFNGRQLTNIYFEDVTASYNTHPAGGGGICISEKVGTSTDITLVDITAEHNGRDGILVWTWYDYCSISDVTVIGGLFTNNGWAGIRVLNWPASGSKGGTVENVHITEAQIENNPYIGVWFELGYSSSDATSSYVNYNNIEGNANYGILNSGDGVLCGKCNWWGDISGPSGVGSGSGDPVSDSVIYCPWLTDEYPYGDCIGGAICWNQQTGEYFCSIQAAIDDPDTNDQTGDHDTIEVFAVTDVEQVNVYKSVTIFGQGIGNTIIQSPDILTDYFTTSNNNYPIVYINNVDDVIIHNLTVDGLGKGNANYRFIGIGIYQAGTILKDVEVINVKDTPFSGAQHGIGIYGWSDATGIAHNVMVKDCFVYDYQKTGIALGGSDLDVDINNCEITGVGPTTVTAQNGIQVSNSATGSITENVVSGCSYIGASWAASGILPYLSGGVLDISDNIISENQANIYLCACSAEITGNSISASATGTGQTYFYGIIGDPGDPPLIPDASPLDEGTPPTDKTTYVITCEDNMVTGDGSSGGVGIGVYAGMYGTYDIEFTAMHNNVLDWGYGFELYEYAPNNLISANINYNNIVGNDYGIYNWLSTSYDCTCNWYGDISGPTHPTNPLGIGDPVSDFVIVAPWLNLPFEDPESVCEVGLCQDIVYIDDDFTSSTPGWYIDHFSSIQIALDRLETGGTAVIYDGEYDEEVIIDDDFCDNTGITIKGAYESFPIEESAVLYGNITISVNDVTINYLEFKPSPEDAAILVEDGVSGTCVELNIFFREECESDTVIGVESLGTSLVDAEYNWWSVPDGPYNGVLDNGKLSNGLGVTVIGEVFVEPWIGIHAAADISPIHVIVGDPIIFDAVDSFGYSTNKNELFLSYLWDFDDDSWSMEEQISYSYDEPGVYHGYLRVSANDVNLWSRTMYDWDYFTIIVSEPGQPLGANADGNDLGGYEGIIEEPVLFYGTPSGGVPGYNFEWDINEQTLSGQTVEYTFIKAGLYTIKLTVTDSEFNTATDTATVYIAGLDELVAKAGGPYETTASEPVYLTGDASGGKAPYTFSWDFGDGSAQITAQNPLHVYETEGSYTVTLTVTDPAGNSDEATTTVIVNGNHGQPDIVNVKGGLGIKATVISADLPVDWMITIDGNNVFGRTTATGTIAPNNEEIIRAPYVFGLGNVDISIKANDAVSKHTAFMFGPFVLFIK